jgi:hypothetical protein
MSASNWGFDGEFRANSNFNLVIADKHLVISNKHT